MKKFINWLTGESLEAETTRLSLWMITGNVVVFTIANLFV